MNDIVKTEQKLPSVTPVDLLSIAVEKGSDIEKLQQLWDLQLAWEKNEAKKAYHRAISEFKQESIKIIKNKKVSFKTEQGETSYNHASLDHVLEVTMPELAKHGLSHRWDIDQGDGGRISIKCILTHALGHAEYAHLSGSPDDSGKKNNIQRVASTVTYLERYTFLAITGLAAKDNDDDGKNSGEQKGYQEGWNDSQRYYMACFEHSEVIKNVKDQLADNNLEGAAEYLFSLNTIECQSIARAPTKGGIFSLDERKQMRGIEWDDAAKKGRELNPDVDKEMKARLKEIDDNPGHAIYGTKK